MSGEPPIIEMPASFSAESRLLETPATKAADRLLFWGLTALLLFGPIAFGATEPWSVAVLQTGAVFLLMAWCVRQVVAEVAVFQSSFLFKPMGLFAAVVAVQIFASLSAYRQAAVVEAMNYLAYAAILFVTVQLFFYGQRLRLFAEALTWYGCGVSFFAILQGLTSNGKIYWLRPPRFASAIYGPYANRNHYAGLMEMLVPFALAVCLSRRASTGIRLVAALASLLMAGSIFLSGSRGGMAAFVAEMIFLFMVNSNLRKRTAPGWRTLILFASLVVFLIWMDITPALSRWTAIEGDLQAGRLAIARDCLRMFMQRPAIGWGLGAFPYVYPQFRTFYTDYYINQTHNDWLQVLVETGFAGAIAMLWFVFNLFRDSLLKLSPPGGRGSMDGSSVRLAALTSCTGILVHSLFDFNLHVPANAALFFALCAIACWGPAELRSPAESEAASS